HSSPPAVSSLTPADDSHEDTISLKDPIRNAFIGVGSLPSHIPSKRLSPPSLLLMPATGGLLALETFAPPSSSSASSTAIATARLKSRVEQAVFYGDRSDNPLSFDLSPDYRGDAAEAAEAVSQEILSSSQYYVLSERRLQAETCTRRRLCQDAEKAKAAIDVWDYQNRVMERQLEDGADQQEGIALHERWEAMKPRVIRPLVSIDRIEPAYELAEHHRDFPTLVWLCHDAVAGAGAARLQGYIEKFGEEFAFVLYQWYIDQRQFHALLTQDEVYGALVTKFFRDPSTGGKATAQYPELAWIHDIACKRYGDAAEALLAVNGDRAERSQKQLISSIGKLAAVANIKIKGDSSQRKKILIALDDELDLIAVQDALRDSLLSVTPPIRSTQTPLEAFVAAHLTNLRDRPAFRQLFVSLAQRVVAGEALEIEDLVDVLTLKDNRAEEGGDGAVALDRLVRDSELPEGRKQVALLSVWRRVFVRDDWTTIANTSGRSEEAQRQMLRRTLAYETMRAIGSLK
ncbi:hypothetical protein JCM24511_00102, partial [Saitozyma sp. JCM 24511]